MRSECRRTISTAKRRVWENYFSSMNVKANAKMTWRVVKSLSGISNGLSFPSLSRGDGGVISDNKCKANVIASAFARVSSSANYPACFKSKQATSDLLTSENITNVGTTEPLNRPFTIFELQSAIASRKNTSPGDDTICYPMLKKLSAKSLQYLLRLFNSSWSEGKVPKTWKHAIVIPILKSGKDPSSASSYRPISLTSHICKVMEVMVVKRLRWYLETRGLLHISQSGFRRERSSVDHILRLHDAVYKSLINQSSVIAVFLDIERAYDMVWRDGLIIKLQKLGIRGLMLQWI